MAKILLLETATDVCSTTISIDGVITGFSETPEAPSHAALLTLQISDCARQAGIALADLDAIALSQGPGSYTSLRVGASVAKGICYALDKPLIAVNTLHALAYGCAQQYDKAASDLVFAPMLDARRQEIWLALYDASLNEIAPAQALILENNSFYIFISNHVSGLENKRVVLCGNGMDKTRNATVSENTVFSEIKRCSASYLLELAMEKFQHNDFQDIAYFEPHYMKPPNITSSTKAPF